MSEEQIPLNNEDGTNYPTPRDVEDVVGLELEDYPTDTETPPHQSN